MQFRLDLVTCHMNFYIEFATTCTSNFYSHSQIVARFTLFPVSSGARPDLPTSQGSACHWIVGIRTTTALNHLPLIACLVAVLYNVFIPDVLNAYMYNDAYAIRGSFNICISLGAPCITVRVSVLFNICISLKA